MIATIQHIRGAWKCKSWDWFVVLRLAHWIYLVRWKSGNKQSFVCGIQNNVIRTRSISTLIVKTPWRNFQELRFLMVVKTLCTYELLLALRHNKSELLTLPRILCIRCGCKGGCLSRLRATRFGTLWGKNWFRQSLSSRYHMWVNLHRYNKQRACVTSTQPRTLSLSNMSILLNSDGPTQASRTHDLDFEHHFVYRSQVQIQHLLNG